MSRQRVLTGITTSGTPHLGNYVGAIRPALVASRRDDVDAFYFMADYHALIKCLEPTRVQRSRLEIAATWLACGLDPERTTFYRQSDIPEIPELTWLLTCITAKGLLNRAHAYKAAVEANTGAAEDADAGINAGLYMYPVLMAADILAFNANRVPVGRDQVQHIEMARDIAARFNHIYGGYFDLSEPAPPARGGTLDAKTFFVLPEASVEEHVATLPGLDGRKMSKSYDNTIPLFAGGPNALRAAIMRIITDSREPGESKQAEGSTLFAIYQAFAGADAGRAFAAELTGGLAWGEAKQRLFDLIDGELAPMRARYDELMAKPQVIEDILQAGAVKARAQAAPLLARLRQAVGLGHGKPPPAKAAKRKKAAQAPRAVSFRDSDGSFRFRLLAADGEPLALSRAFADPKAAAQAGQRLLAAGTIEVRGEILALLVDGEVVAETPAIADPGARAGALAKLHEELAETRSH